MFSSELDLFQEFGSVVSFKFGFMFLAAVSSSEVLFC